MTDSDRRVRRASDALGDERPPVVLGGEVAPEVDDALRSWGLQPTRHPQEAAAAGVRPAVAITNDPALVARLPDVAWVHSPSAGVDRLLADGTGPDALVTRTVGQMPRRMAEYVLAVALSHQWSLPRYRSAQLARRWQGIPTPTYLYEQECWVIGTGEVGTGIAATLTAHGCDVVGVSSSGGRRAGWERTVAWQDLPQVVPAGLVVAALPSTPATRSKLDATFFDRCVGAHLVNVGRGATVDLDDLVHALDAGTVAHASLDVTQPEPPEPGSPVWDHPQITLTPHVSGPTHPSDVVEAFAAARADLLAGRLPATAVDVRRGY